MIRFTNWLIKAAAWEKKFYLMTRVRLMTSSHRWWIPIKYFFKSPWDRLLIWYHRVWHEEIYFASMHDWSYDYADVVRGILKEPFEEYGHLYHPYHWWDEDVLLTTSRTGEGALWGFTVQSLNIEVDRLLETFDEDGIGLVCEEKEIRTYLVRKPSMQWQDVARTCLQYCKDKKWEGKVYLDGYTIGYVSRQFHSHLYLSKPYQDGLHHEMIIPKLSAEERAEEERLMKIKTDVREGLVKCIDTFVKANQGKIIY